MSSIDMNSEGAAAGGTEPAESPVLIHAWEVDPTQAGVAVQHLHEMLGEAATAPGLVSARVLESADRSSIAVVMEMRTVEDRRRLSQLPAVRETLDHLHGTLNVIIRLYRQVASYPG